MTKAYISGQITGDDDYINKFEKAEEYYLQQFNEVINPCKLDTDLTKPWIWYIVRDLYLIWTANVTHIVMLPCWKKSIGAQIERLVAIKKGVKVIYNYTNESTDVQDRMNKLCIAQDCDDWKINCEQCKFNPNFKQNIEQFLKWEKIINNK